MNEQTARLTLAAQTVAITEYVISDYKTLLILRNNHNERVVIDDILIDMKKCVFFYNQNPTLNPGQTKQVECKNIYELDETSVSWPLVINWTDKSSNAQYTQSGTDLQLTGDVAIEYLSVLQANEYWDGTNGCFNLSTSSPHPVCTCLDLEQMSSNASNRLLNYSLQNSIDFLRCQEEFGDQGWNSGSGWRNSGSGGSNSLRGSFFGNYHAIGNLYANNASGNVGLFGQTYYSASGWEYSIYNNLILHDVFLAGSTIGGLLSGNHNDGTTIDNIHVRGILINNESIGLVGGLVAGSEEGDIIISRSSFEGEISSTATNSRIGGLAGDTIGSIIDSYVVANLSNTGGDASGLAYGAEVLVSNSYFEGSIYANGEAGGLLGRSRYADDIIDSYVDANITGTTRVGGIAANGREMHVTNSYVKGSLTGTGDVGGVFGSASFETSLYISGVTVYATINGGINTGGVIGTYTSGTGTILNTKWTNHTSDDALTCIGAGGLAPNAGGNCIIN